MNSIRLDRIGLRPKGQVCGMVRKTHEPGTVTIVVGFVLLDWVFFNILGFKSQATLAHLRYIEETPF